MSLRSISTLLNQAAAVVRYHDGKAQLIVACKAQLMSGLEPYELAHILSLIHI